MSSEWGRGGEGGSVNESCAIRRTGIRSKGKTGNHSPGRSACAGAPRPSATPSAGLRSVYLDWHFPERKNERDKVLKSHLAESVLSGSQCSCRTNYIQSNAIREICNEPANEICSKVNNLECFNTYNGLHPIHFSPSSLLLTPTPPPPHPENLPLFHGASARMCRILLPRAALGNVSYWDVICIQIFPEWTPSATRTSVHCCSAAPTAARRRRRLKSHWCEASLPLKPCAFLLPANGIRRERCSWSVTVLRRATGTAQSLTRRSNTRTQVREMRRLPSLKFKACESGIITGRREAQNSAVWLLILTVMLV